MVKNIVIIERISRETYEYRVVHKRDEKRACKKTAELVKKGIEFEVTYTYEQEGVERDSDGYERWVC